MTTLKIRPTNGTYGVFKQIDMYHAEKLFTGSYKECDFFIQKEEHNAFASWLTDGKQGGALQMLTNYEKAVTA